MAPPNSGAPRTAHRRAQVAESARRSRARAKEERERLRQENVELLAELAELAAAVARLEDVNDVRGPRDDARVAKRERLVRWMAAPDSDPAPDHRGHAVHALAHAPTITDGDEEEDDDVDLAHSLLEHTLMAASLVSLPLPRSLREIDRDLLAAALQTCRLEGLGIIAATQRADSAFASPPAQREWRASPDSSFASIRLHTGFEASATSFPEAGRTKDRALLLRADVGFVNPPFDARMARDFFARVMLQSDMRGRMLGGGTASTSVEVLMDLSPPASPSSTVSSSTASTISTASPPPAAPFASSSTTTTTASAADEDVRIVREHDANTDSIFLSVVSTGVESHPLSAFWSAETAAVAHNAALVRDHDADFDADDAHYHIGEEKEEKEGATPHRHGVVQCYTVTRARAKASATDGPASLAAELGLGCRELPLRHTCFFWDETTPETNARVVRMCVAARIPHEVSDGTLVKTAEDLALTSTGGFNPILEALTTKWMSALCCAGMGLM